ncbi:hypothetical protein [Georgenia sp. SUBG003]|uniref:hypothetical protein n=1 Tax=Georgenia sp. SUBG003 TaxID=1497974 RepID=UPI000AC77305
MTQLNARTLKHVDPDVQRPRYDRAAVRPGILHIGVGGFHRAHQAMYIDRVLATGECQWGIVGVGTLPTDRAMRDALTAQDMMYTLRTTAPDGSTSARIIGSIVEYLYAPDEAEAVLDRLADPSVRIVSLTITEGGYGINDATGAFDPQDEATVADLVRLPLGAVPRSALGFLFAGLRARRDAGQVPFTVLSCDNIQSNGAHAKKALLSFAERVDPTLARWIAQEVSFPQLHGRPDHAGYDCGDASADHS